MKNLFIKGIYLVITALCLQSCLDFDIPGDENTEGQEQGDDVVYYGKADNISYKIEISQDGFKAAKVELENLLGQLQASEYALRGAKDGDLPGPHAYQFQFNLTVDNYAGYFCLPQNFDGRMRSTYYASEAFNGGPSGGFLAVKNSLVPLLNHPTVDSIPELKAIALLLYNYSAQEMADVYGPFPYIDYKENKQKHPYAYNNLKEIYMGIVSNIDTITACFKYFENRPVWYKQAIADLLLERDVLTDINNKTIDAWDRFANSLKLRMAMRVVKVMPDKAKEWAEEAVASGVIEGANQQICLAPEVIGFSHPLTDISETWNDSRLNASYETLMKSLNHPYLTYAFIENSMSLVNENDPTKILSANSRIVGLRAGIRMPSGQSYESNPRTAFSRIDANAIAASPLFLMKLSEVDLLRAEGALRGWNMGGSAQLFYENGIRDAFVGDPYYNDEYQLKVSAYMALEKAIKYTYEDPINEQYSAPSMTQIGVKWSEGDDLETKLEKIITQKYIANFPYSFEAWSDLRRTGYPKIFPVLNTDDSDGSIAQGELIRRMFFPGKDTEAIKVDIEISGIQALEGADLQGTRLWWDTTGLNF